MRPDNDMPDDKDIIPVTLEESRLPEGTIHGLPFLVNP